MKKVSIIIPTYNHCSDLLKPAIESIIQNTTLDDVECIIVANGCTDNTREYVESLGEPFRLIWSDEPIGYTNATIKGIENSTGEYIILLNNDVVLYGPKDDWINKLLTPLEQDSTVGLTGPMKVVSEHTGGEFIIFFCAAFRRKDYDAVGGIDQIFSPGFQEDVDFAHKIKNLGLNIVQVPAPSDKYCAPSVMTGDFPIWHKGHATFKELSDEKRASWYRNIDIIQSRYGKAINIEKALQCDGYMSEAELKFLATEANKHKTIIEVGSWHGRSTRALGDNTSGIVYAVDHFNGSAAEPQNHGSARWENGDHAFMEFMRNNWDLIQKGKIVPLRGSSASMAKELKNLGVKADMIFIDGGHTYEEVKEDIGLWKDLLEKGGLYCGHDMHAWAGVTQAVQETIENPWVAPNTTIWTGLPKKGKIFDCFPFFNEFDVLDIRLNELYDTVDYFVISEGNKTHSGKPKPYNLEENKERYQKFWDKIIYVKAEMPEFKGDRWELERYQRDCLTKGILEKAQDGDVIMISDADEIPSPDVIKHYSTSLGLVALTQKLYYYTLNCYQGLWDQAKIIPYTLFKTMTPCQVRYTTSPMMDNGGWHFSYLGTPEQVKEKVESFAHGEYDTEETKQNISERMEKGVDLYGRNTDGKFVEIDDTYPRYVVENKEKLKDLIK